MSLAYVMMLMAANVVEPTKEETDAALDAIVDCYRSEAAKLDDGTSGADVIASAVVDACSRQLDVMDGITKRKIISIAQATPGISQHEKNKLALGLLAERPQETRKLIEQKALTVVLMARRKSSAQD